MESMDPSLIAQMLNSGGNTALILCSFFIYRASERLARIEKALDLYLKQLQESK